MTRFAEVGLAITPRNLPCLAYKYYQLNSINHKFNQPAKVAGKDWFKAFMKKHPEISRRQAQFMNPTKAQKQLINLSLMITSKD